MSNVKKLRQKAARRKFKMRRGYMKQFSAERINAGQTVDKSHIPEDHQAYFEYRKHAKINPKQAWLDTLFPGVHMTSAERGHILAKLDEITNKFDQPQFVQEYKTKISALYTYFDNKQNCYWLLEKTRNIVRRSHTYMARENALQSHRLNRVRWAVEYQFEFKTSPS